MIRKKNYLFRNVTRTAFCSTYDRRRSKHVTFTKYEKKIRVINFKKIFVILMFFLRWTRTSVARAAFFDVAVASRDATHDACRAERVDGTLRSAAGAYFDNIARVARVATRRAARRQLIAVARDRCAIAALLDVARASRRATHDGRRCERVGWTIAVRASALNKTKRNETKHQIISTKMKTMRTI